MKKEKAIAIILAAFCITSFYAFENFPVKKRIVYAIAFKDTKCKKQNGDTLSTREHVEIKLGAPAQNPYTERERLTKELEKKYSGTVIRVASRIAEGEVVLMIKFKKELPGYDCKPLIYLVGAGNTYDEALEDATKIIDSKQAYEIIIL